MGERITVSVAMLDARVYQYDMCGSDTLLQLEAKLHSTQSIPACSQMGEPAVRYQFLPTGWEGDFALQHDATLSGISETFPQSKSESSVLELTAYVIEHSDLSLEAMASQQKAAEAVHGRYEMVYTCGTCGFRLATSMSIELDMNMCRRCYRRLSSG